jgi:hypothetical protein
MKPSNALSPALIAPCGLKSVHNGICFKCDTIIKLVEKAGKISQQ